MNAHTAGTATNRPKAVHTRASEIPADTAPIPPDPVKAIPRKALMMPTTVPNSPTKGAVAPIVATTGRVGDAPRPVLLPAVPDLIVFFARV